MGKSRTERLREKARKEKWSLGFLILLFSLISFYTSYTGLVKLAGVSEYNYVLKVFMAILVLGLQIALVFSVNAFYFKDLFKRNWIKAVVVLCIYLITMTLSVTFSFSYWYEEFSAESYAKRSSEIQLNRVKNSLIEAKNSFSTMESSLTRISNYSITLSNREKTFGGTCGGVARTGEGPFTWLRADDAAYTKNYSKEIQKLKKDLEKEIEEVSTYLESFDPKGNVLEFNQIVNDRITSINLKFFNNPILKSLKSLLLERSGQNRKNISVVSKKTGRTSIESCMDRDFTFGANRVIRGINSLTSIELLNFFNMSDSKKLFGRTTGVLFALIDPSYEIKSTSDMTNPTDITYEDIYAVLGGFVIDLLILFIAIYGKEPKVELVPIKVVKKILNGDYPNEVLNKLRPFLAEMNKFHLIAIPNDVEDEDIDNKKQFMIYMQQNKLAKLYINEIKATRLNRYFSNSLKEKYSESTFRVYKISKTKFNQFVLQNIEEGEYNV